MRFREAVAVCFQDYWTFSGRASRSEYWWFFLFIIVGSLVLALIDRALFGEDMLLGFGGLFSLFTILPQAAVAWRRMHDTGRSGFFNLLPGIPLVPVFHSVLRPGNSIDPSVVVILAGLAFILSLVVLVLLILPSQPGRNRYDTAAPD
ncbi:MAG TPA: DUF805 domain-containing protein [Thermohalobaculum sp.]|nr:DUF805 domain-containing protein [Thermohalobaculum sp.]